MSTPTDHLVKNHWTGARERLPARSARPRLRREAVPLPKRISPTEVAPHRAHTIGDMLGRRTFALMMLVASLALGVLGMHGLSTVINHGAPQHGGMRPDTNAPVALSASQVPEDPGGHATIHLSDVCLWLLVAGLGAAGAALAMRAASADRSSPRLPTLPRGPARSRAGPSPPPAWSHLKLAVLLR